MKNRSPVASAKGRTEARTRGKAEVTTRAMTKARKTIGLLAARAGVFLLALVFAAVLFGAIPLAISKDQRRGGPAAEAARAARAGAALRWDALKLSSGIVRVAATQEAPHERERKESEQREDEPSQGQEQKSETESTEEEDAAKVEVEAPPAPDCSRKALIYYANQAPAKFEREKRGLLYGVRTHTPATRVRDMPGYNSCALVVYAILKRAGCKWVRRTASAKSIYDQAWRAGWRPATEQNGGCLVAWNSRFKGSYPRIGRGVHRDPTKRGGVYNRHLGITTSAWMSVDNTSYRSAPSAFTVVRPFRYEPPLYLCPPEQ